MENKAQSMQRRAALALALALALPGAACTEPAGPRDAGGDAAVGDAAYASCASVGVACQPADPCGLGSICSEQHRCIPAGYRDCDDGIECTRDECMQGGCKHTVETNHCLIGTQCASKEEKSGECGRCDPSKSTTQWTPVEGATCDDGNDCTQSDYCVKGTCVGIPFSCNDGLPCTTDKCDGKGGCSYQLKPDYCQIDKGCYKDGDVDPSDSTNCKICDVATSTKSWTEPTGGCRIHSKCYGAGDKDSTGCYLCDPLASTTSWTMLQNRCLVGQECVLSGVYHQTKCALCNPTKSTSAWTPVGKAQLQVVSFKTDATLEVSPSVGGVGWQRSTERYWGSPASLYYGNPSTLTYANGQASSGTAVMAAVKLAENQKAYLTFHLYMDTETVNTKDVLTVYANDAAVWVKTTKTLPAANYKTWVEVVVDLASFAAQSVQLKFVFDTVDASKNSTEGVYIDEITLFTGCGI
jgi:hypothetical protein